MPTKHPPGLYWHVRCGVLMEFCRNYQERADYIRKEHEEYEIATHLRLFKLVRGKLPHAVSKALNACTKALNACTKALNAYTKACDVYLNACGKAQATLDKARDDAYDKARADCDKACAAYTKAQATLNKSFLDNMPAIEALHTKECPNCPWDGKTIFPAA